MVLEVIFTVRVLLLLAENAQVSVTVFVFVLKEPLVTVISDVVKLSCRVHPHPTPLNVIEDAIVTQLNVSVFPVVVAKNPMFPV